MHTKKDLEMRHQVLEVWSMSAQNCPQKKEVSALDWKAEAIEKLRGYADCKRRLEDSSAQLYEGHLEVPELKQAWLWVTFVEGGLEILDPDGRVILETLYIYPAKGNVARLQEALYIGRSQIYRRRDEALHLFTMALYGVDIEKEAAL